MRKNKKLMLGTIAAMGVMAMGVGGVSTFAWFTANAQATTVANTQALDVKNATLDLGTFYLRLEATGAEALDFTDKNGQIWVISNNKMVHGSGDKQYGTLTLTPYVYKTRTGSDPNWVYSVGDRATPSELQALGAQTWDVNIIASDRARVTFNNPTAMTAGDGSGAVGETNFHKAFYDDNATPKELFQNTIQATIDLDASGNLKIKIKGADDNTLAANIPVYVSVCGNTDNAVPTLNGSPDQTDVYNTKHDYGLVTLSF